MLYNASVEEKRHDDELCNLYSSPNIVRVTKSRKVRLVVHAARMVGMRNTYRISVGRY
jgi:hypothetical protein